MACCQTEDTTLTYFQSPREATCQKKKKKKNKLGLGDHNPSPCEAEAGEF